MTRVLPIFALLGLAACAAPPPPATPSYNAAADIRAYDAWKGRMDAITAQAKADCIAKNPDHPELCDGKHGGFRAEYIPTPQPAAAPVSYIDHAADAEFDQAQERDRVQAQLDRLNAANRDLQSQVDTLTIQKGE